jgi:hypothetical protein
MTILAFSIGFEQDLESHNIVFKIFWIESKTTQHGKRQVTDANAKKTQRSELSDKVVIIKMTQPPVISNLKLCERGSLSKKIKKI